MLLIRAASTIYEREIHVYILLVNILTITVEIVWHLDLVETKSVFLNYHAIISNNIYIVQFNVDKNVYENEGHLKTKEKKYRETTQLKMYCYFVKNCKGPSI